MIVKQEIFPGSDGVKLIFQWKELTLWCHAWFVYDHIFLRHNCFTLLLYLWLHTHIEKGHKGLKDSNTNAWLNIQHKLDPQTEVGSIKIMPKTDFE